VPAHQLADYVERVVRHFLTERSDGESFAAWVQRADDEVLR
jgi:sulfite reductase (ferredoxin)